MQLGLNIVFQPTLTKLRLGKVGESIAKRWAGGFPLRDQFGEDLIKFARVFTGNGQGPGEQAVLLRVRAFALAAADDRVDQPAIGLECWWNRVILFAHGGALLKKVWFMAASRKRFARG